MSWYSTLRPILFKLDAERAHHAVFALAGFAQTLPGILSWLERSHSFRSPLLTLRLFGKELHSPLGVAAGLDKNGVLLDLFAALGFAFVEVGSITNLATTGNPKPRLFRLPADHALINRLGLNNQGPVRIRENIGQHRCRAKLLLGINIAKTNSAAILHESAVTDMVDCYQALQDLGDYTVINISCPNTEDGRTFEEPESLRQLLAGYQALRSTNGATRPLLVKFSPDTSLADLERGLEICEEHHIDGYVLCNTTVNRSGLKTESARLEKIGRGGLSGAPLLERSTERVAHAYRLLRGKKPIIGVGGVDSAATAYRYIRAGASLVGL